MPSLAPLLQTFEKHAQRRAAGVPTPEVLVGQDAVAGWLELQEPCGVVRFSSTAAIRGAAAYLDAPLVRSRLASRIESRVLAARSSLPNTTARTEYEAEVWSELARDTLIAAGDSEMALLVATVIGRESAEMRAFTASVRVLGDDAPALLIDAANNVDAAVRAAVAFSEASPRAHVAVATDASEWVRWTESPGRDHAKALLRACVAELPPESSVVGKVRSLDEARVLGARAKDSHTPADNDAARSAAEHALFEALEAMPSTNGKFALNHRLDILFGNRELEIDLACQALRLAVEVDGYFHFQSADAYRRDRRKDIVLQQEGYLVVRVLAEDITDRLDDVIATIHRVMIHLESRGDGNR